MIELVWDGRTEGTVQAANGATLLVGADHRWSADDLVMAGLATAVMRSYITLATRRGTPTLGFICAASVSTTRHGTSAHVRVVVMTDTSTDLDAVRAMVARAAIDAPLCRLLGDALTVDVEARQVSVRCLT